MDLTALHAAVDRAMQALREDVAEQAEGRNLIATGATLRNTRAFTIGGRGSVQAQVIIGRLEAPDNWKYWGSGRGPGAMPPVASIQAWVDAKGLDISAWAVAKSIAQRGTRDYRQGGENIVELAADNWDLDEVEREAGRAFEDPFFELVKQAVRPLQN